MERVTYKMIIAYDGTEFAGWLQQPTRPTVSRTLWHAFHKVFKSPLSLAGASKTDAGVHALGAVVRVRVSAKIPRERLFFAWNNVLPSSIVIRSIEPVSSNFHPREQVATKIYWYHFTTKRPLPFLSRYVMHMTYDFDMQRLQDTLKLFVGAHNFRAFVTEPSEVTQTIRTIDAIVVRYIRRWGIYQIEVRGQHFLRHQIRRIIGAALAVARKKMTLDKMYVIEALKTGSSSALLPTAPARGLLLRKIIYKQ